MLICCCCLWEQPDVYKRQVYNANAFRHQPEKRLVGYLNDAGGATREADQKRIFVIHALSLIHI